VKRVLACVALAGFSVALSSPVQSQGQATPAPVTHKGLEMAVAGVERAPNAGLTDCPPGANTVRAMSKPGEGFAIVTVRMKVLPGYKPVPLRRPVLTDTAGKTYNTAVSFVDIGKVPEFSCAFPFRIPDGTRLKSVQIDTVSLDLVPFDTTPR